MSARNDFPLHAQLFVPEHGETTGLPAVVVSHGYLGNSGFLEIPWAADLTELGLAALFLDRPGHGRSPGAWWPRTADAPKLTELYPDIHTAIGYLRTLAPLIDPQRIALLGHSDGGTAVITAASADWDIAATVSLSASVAPWEYVNHVAPKNLLLLYGADDRFVVADTDTLLMKNATRGYLSGEGRVGSIEDGSARRLLRVAGRGHLDVVYSEEARRAALGWLAETFGLRGEIALAPTGTKRVVAATVVLFLLVLLWNGVPAPPEAFGSLVATLGRTLAVAVAWTGGLVVAAWLAPRWREAVPAQEGNTVASLLLAQFFVMGAVGMVLRIVGVRYGVAMRCAHPRTVKIGRARLLPSRTSPPRLAGRLALPTRDGLFGGGHEGHPSLSWDVARGAFGGLIVQLAVETAFRPMYTTSVAPQRLALSAMFLALAAPAFAATCGAVGRIGGDGFLVRGIPGEAVLAAITAALAPRLFVRMSMLPVLAFAVVLLFTAAYRASGRSNEAAAAFGAVMYARLGSVVCAFY